MTQDPENLHGAKKDPAKRPSAPDSAAAPDAWKKIMKCDEIREILFDYLCHELGEGRSTLVREHLRKCPDCQAAAAEMQNTLDVLGKAKSGDVPDRLSPERRARIMRASMYPALDWIENHVAIAAILAVLIVVLLTVLAFMFKLPEPPPIDGPSYTVTIGLPRTNAPSPDAPAPQKNP
jgi:predicted anti-sigma-YlaC factor YlaD